MPSILEYQSRVERLREIVRMIAVEKKNFSAYDLAVHFNVSIGMIYRDIQALKLDGAIPIEWTFAKKERGYVVTATNLSREIANA